MNLTTRDMVKDRLKKTDTDDDADIDMIIGSVSDAMTRDMDRFIESARRTVEIDVRPYTRRVHLRGYPVTSVEEVRNDSSRDFPADSTIDPERYYVSLRNGQITFDYEIRPGYGALRVTYTGGMASSTTGLIANGFADIVEAATAQSVHLYKRRQTPHLASMSDGVGNTTYGSEIDWLDWVLRVIERYRNPVDGS